MKTVPLRRLLRPLSQSDRQDLPVLSVYRDHGVVHKDSRSDNFNKTPEDVSRYLHVQPGNLVVNKMKAWSGSVAVSSFEGIVSGDYLVCSVSPEVQSMYLHHLLRSSRFVREMQMRSVGIRPNQERLYWDDLAGIAIPLPPYEVQRRIADFLDDRVARIDQIITARREQVSLQEDAFRRLLEDRIWSDARPMPLKRLLVDVTSGPRGWGDLVGDAGTPFVRIANLSPLGIELLARDLVCVSVPDDSGARRAALRLGDVLLSITAAFGEVAVWREGSGTFSQHVARLRPASSQDADWIAWVLQTSSAHDQYRLSAYGGTKVGMGLEQVRNLHVPDVSSGERRAAVIDLAAAWAGHQMSSSTLLRGIDLLSEFKQSLITAAVTGELDVTTAGSGIPG